MSLAEIATALAVPLGTVKSRLHAAIDALRRERIRLIALIPLRTSLEEYFVEKLQHSQTTAGMAV